MAEFVNTKDFIPGNFYLSDGKDREIWCYLGRNYDKEYIWVLVKDPKQFAQAPMFSTLVSDVSHFGRNVLRITKLPLHVSALRFKDTRCKTPEVASILGGYSMPLPKNIAAFIENWTFWYYTNVNLDIFRTGTLKESELMPGALYLLESHYKESFVYIGKSTKGWLVWYRMSTKTACNELVRKPNGKYIFETVNKAVFDNNVCDVITYTARNERILAMTDATAEVRGLRTLVNKAINLHGFTPEYLQTLCNCVQNHRNNQRAAQVTKTQISLIRSLVTEVTSVVRYGKTCRQTADSLQFVTDCVAYDLPLNVLERCGVQVPTTTNNKLAQNSFDACAKRAYYSTGLEVNVFVKELRNAQERLQKTGFNEREKPYIINFRGRNHGFNVALLVYVLKLLGPDAEIFLDNDPIHMAYIRSDIGRALLCPVRIFGDALTDKSIADKVIE